jgi:hypothetical protein
MEIEAYKRKHRIEDELSRAGVKVLGSGKQLKCKCPFHEDGEPSFSIDSEKQLWKCHAGCGGGSVIDLVMRLENKTIKQLLSDGDQGKIRIERSIPKPTKPQPEPQREVEAIYTYQDALGNDAFEVVRYKPKTFRQRRKVNGTHVWGMDGVERYLYRLPQVLKADTVWIVEGEKDADNLVALGYCATCNVGGAGKWLDAYTDELQGKKVVLCGDKDQPGKEHVELVFSSIAGKVAEARIVELPDPHKDVSDYIAARGTDAKRCLDELAAASHPFVKGIRTSIQHIGELEAAYFTHAKRTLEDGIKLGAWLPSLSYHVRDLVAGELVLVLGATGVGKTAVLCNLALALKRVPQILFECELPGELLFERFTATKCDMPSYQVETAYQATNTCHGMDAMRGLFGQIHVCTESKLSVDRIEKLINQSEAKIGERPRLVLIDYAQLLQGRGSSRYDRFSNIAEDLKIMAKTTRTVVVVASQVGRKSDDAPVEVTLMDAKESGSWENSAGLVLGVWRNPDNDRLMYLRILKNTKGTAGRTVECNYDGERLKITELAKM